MSHDAATSISLVTRSGGGAPTAVAVIPVTPEFRTRYEVGEVLGSGAMGMVSRARDLANGGRVVAIKFLTSFGDEVMTARFLQEGRLLARATHPHVVAVYDLDVMAGHPYIVAEFMGGGTLGQRMERGPMPLGEAARVLSACADAVAFLHERGIVHRDLKPDNVLFDERGAPKLADLGIAKELTGAALTRTGSLLGTPRYMAPEQACMDNVVPASDVHALAVIFFEMLTGRAPWEALSLTGLLGQIANTPPPPLEGLPEPLAGVIARAFAKQPEARPTARELAQALEAVAAPDSGKPRRPARNTAPRPRVSAPIAVPPVPARPARGRRIAGLVAAIVVAALAGAAGMKRMPPKSAHPVESSAPATPVAPSPQPPELDALLTALSNGIFIDRGFDRKANPEEGRRRSAAALADLEQTRARLERTGAEPDLLAPVQCVEWMLLVDTLPDRAKASEYRRVAAQLSGTLRALHVWMENGAEEVRIHPDRFAYIMLMLPDLGHKARTLASGMGMLVAETQDREMMAAASALDRAMQQMTFARHEGDDSLPAVVLRVCAAYWCLTGVGVGSGSRVFSDGRPYRPADLMKDLAKLEAAVPAKDREPLQKLSLGIEMSQQKRGSR